MSLGQRNVLKVDILQLKRCHTILNHICKGESRDEQIWGRQKHPVSSNSFKLPFEKRFIARNAPSSKSAKATSQNYKSLRYRTTVTWRDKLVKQTCIVMHFGSLRATVVVVDKTSSNPVPPEEKKRKRLIWFIHLRNRKHGYVLVVLIVQFSKTDLIRLS